MFQHTFYPINSLSVSLPLFTLFEPEWPLSGALCLLVTHIHCTMGSCPAHTTVSNHWPESTFVSAMLKGTSNTVIKEGGKVLKFTTRQDRHTCYFPESDGSKVVICTGGQHLSYFQVLMFQKIFFFVFFSNSLPRLARPSLLQSWQAITRLLLWPCPSLGTRKGSLLGKNNKCALDP